MSRLDDEAAVLDREHARDLDDAGLDVDRRLRRTARRDVVTDDRPGCQSPSAAIGCGPICLQASAHDMPFDGLSLTWMRPPAATSDAALDAERRRDLLLQRVERVDRRDADRRD